MSRAKKNTVESFIDSLPRAQTSLSARLNPEQTQEIHDLAEIYRTDPTKITEVGWERLAETFKMRWGLKTLSSRTLRRAINIICDEQKEKE